MIRLILLVLAAMIWGWQSIVLFVVFAVLQFVVWCGEHPLPVDTPDYMAGNEFPMLPIEPEIRFEPRYPDMPQQWNWTVHLYLLDEIDVYDFVDRA